MADRLLTTALPPRDVFDLAGRLRGVIVSELPKPPPRPQPQVGDLESFWVVEQDTARVFPETAVLRHATPHAYWYVQIDWSNRVAQEDLERSAAVFEERTYPLVGAYFGPEPVGTNGDAHVVFFLGDVPGVAAYFSGADTYPQAVYPRSNEREMIYVNLSALRPAEAGFDSTIAHELQHLVHFGHCPIQETWIDEGSSELAPVVAGLESTPFSQFAERPNTQLTQWTTSRSEYARHYQAAYLFMRYFEGRFGGAPAMSDLLATCERGADLFDAFLRAHQVGEDFDRLFADWAVANLADGATGDTRFDYPQDNVHVRVSNSLDPSTASSMSLPQYAADYVQLPLGRDVSFSGNANISLLPESATTVGPVWWSNRSDSLDSWLVRVVNLRDVSMATLRFQAWYDVEERYDYVYLSASTDGGRSWRLLTGRHSRAEDDTGNAYGPGWTGTSGGASEPAWIDEEVDLTPVAGSRVLLRFDYVTDQGYNGTGFALRNVQIPEAGIVDTMNPDANWQADGWVWVDAPIPQRWVLRLVQWFGTHAGVQEVPVGTDGAATLHTDASASRAVLVVVPQAPRTLVPAAFSLRVDAP